MIYKSYLIKGKNGKRLNKDKTVTVYSPKRKTFNGTGGIGRQFLRECENFQDAVQRINHVIRMY